MSDEAWPMVHLEDVASELTVGHVGTMASEYVERGIPFLRSQNVEPHRINTEDVKFISKEFHARLRKSALSPGDVVIVRTGKPGACAVIPKSLPESNCSDLVIVRCGPRLDANFLAYFVNSVAAHHVNAHLVGAVQQHFNVGSARRLVMLLPPLAEQHAIAQILGTLDDKIELNRRMNETLEVMARALFKSWFVDFDPVRAKAEGRDPGLPTYIADLFPDSFEESELGIVPRGWEVRPAGQLYEVGIGKTPPRNEAEWFSASVKGVPWISIRDMGGPGVYISEASECLTPSAVSRFRVRVIPDGIVVLSFKLTVGRVKITDGEMLSNEAIAHFLPRNGSALSSEYLFCYLRMFDYSRLGSTSSIATAVNSESVRSIPVLVPSSKILALFLSSVRPIFDKIKVHQRESSILAALRDALLPKLISGELKVRNTSSMELTAA